MAMAKHVNNDALYDGIVSKYDAIKTNPYKKHIEEPTVWACMGDVRGQTVLDLACGNGYYRAGLKRWSPGCENFSGKFRQKW